jgi:hypothetical protein
MNYNTQPPEPQVPQPSYYQPQQPPTYGYPPQYPVHHAYQLPADGLGIASMVLGICAVIFWWIPIVGLVVAVVAVPLAVVGLRRTMAPATHRLKGFSITGLVTGLVGLGLSSFWTVAIFAAAAA